jgi:hypothetical protein
MLWAYGFFAAAGRAKSRPSKFLDSGIGRLNCGRLEGESDMSKKLGRKSTDANGMELVLMGDAIAAGEESLTSVKATLRVADLGNKTVAKGAVKAIALADGEDGALFTEVLTDLLATGADAVFMRTKIISASNGDIAVTRFWAIDWDDWGGEQRVFHKIKTKTLDEFQIDLAGNIATVEFDARAKGENTLVQVDALALAVEDSLSQSTILIASAVT